jgi:hypothetical protein
MDLFTTCTHLSEPQVITALSLISTLYKPQHPLKLFPACVLTRRSLATASNSGDSSASRPQVLLSQPPVQNSSRLSTQLYRPLFPVSQSSTELPALKSSCHSRPCRTLLDCQLNYAVPSSQSHRAPLNCQPSSDCVPGHFTPIS